MKNKLIRILASLFVAIVPTTIILGITVFLSKPFYAETTIHAGMWSTHLDGKKYNETHNLLGIEKDGYFAYTYLNSHERLSVYVGRIHRGWYRFNDSWSLGYNYGLLTGYNIGGENITPIAFPVLSYDGLIGMDITYAYEAVAVQFRHSFDNKYFKSDRDYQFLLDLVTLIELISRVMVYTH